ncbi:PREDICTED: claudin-4-like [Poecilia mexicana]|uniref:claudin-4-like n=1 Tax=Poecilia mexicana TaxID=48701 RepID=UPI0004441031|nr:PREDICTED: claudin-4-like [Poecilia mexicana]
MESTAVQMLCVALGAIGLTGVTICSSLPEWIVRRNDTEYHYGLWMICVKNRTGAPEWKTYKDAVVPLRSDFHVAQTLITISCILSGLSLLILIFGSDFTSCVQNKNTKPKMILAAGVGLLLAGLLVIIPVSWFSTNMRNAPEGVVLGVSIYIGWTDGLLMILTGVLIWYFSRPK